MQKKKAIELTGCDGQQPKILERQREKEREREREREREEENENCLELNVSGGMCIVHMNVTID